MKRELLSASLLILAASTVWSSAPQYKWHKLIDSKSTGDLIGALAVTSDGNLVSYSAFGSSATTDVFTFDGKDVASGAATSSNTDNKNMLIMKHKADDGSLLWCVSSNCGDISINDGGIVPTPDGGVLALLKLRSSQVSPYYNRPSLVDASGETHPLDAFNNSAWVYNMTLVRIASDGAVEWIRNIYQDQTEIAGKVTTNAVTPSAVTVDGEGNFYLGGNFRSPMAFMGKNNSVHVLTPRNLEGYSNDPQKSAGGFFIVKIDKDGDYLGKIDAGGNDTFDQICGLTYARGKLYFAGKAQGAANSVITMGGKSASLANGYMTVFYGAADTSLSVEYLKTTITYNEVKGAKPTVYPASIEEIDGKLYITGRIVDGLGGDTSSSASVKGSTSMQEAFVLRADASDGTFEGGATHGAGISDYRNVFKDADNNIRLFGYRMSDGAFISTWNGTDAHTSNTDVLISEGGTITTTGCAYDSQNKMLYAIGRGNKAFKMGGVTSEAPQNWGGIVAAYSLGDVAAAVETAVSLSPRFEAGDGVVRVYSPEAMNLEITDASGIVEYNAEVPAGETTIGLASGLHIANGVKLMVR